MDRVLRGYICLMTLVLPTRHRVIFGDAALIIGSFWLRGTHFSVVDWFILRFTSRQVGVKVFYKKNKTSEMDYHDRPISHFQPRGTQKQIEWKPTSTRFDGSCDTAIYGQQRNNNMY